MKSISPVHFIDKLVKKNTVEEDLRELNEQNDVVEIFADPYQMHRSITTLQALPGHFSRAFRSMGLAPSC